MQLLGFQVLASCGRLPDNIKEISRQIDTLHNQNMYVVVPRIDLTMRLQMCVHWATFKFLISEDDIINACIWQLPISIAVQW